MDQGTGLVVAAVVASGPASLAAWASIRTNRRIKTNHGKTIGQHVESLTEWAEFHQAADNEVREVLGLEPASLPLLPPGVQSAYDDKTP